MSPSPVHGQGVTTAHDCRIFRAPWVVPVSSPVVQDGAVVVDRHRILAVGPFRELSLHYPDLPLTSCQGVLLPALVNGHIHLDLSVIGTVQPDFSDSTMCDWIRKLLQKREAANVSQEEIATAAEKTICDQYDAGVGLMLDIGNIGLQRRNYKPVEILSLLEMLGPSWVAQRAVMDIISDLSSKQPVTGHAPYSTGPDLLKFIKKRCGQQETIFSLHLAENIDEALLLDKGEGCFAKFLQERGGVDGTFPVAGIDSRGVAGYLENLGILDDKTLCVHCVHLDDREIQVLAGTGTHVCLCPGSNRFLGVGTAPLEKILAAGILPALGTDSIASNPVLDIWQEMSILAQEHPSVDPATILAMATLGGAKALHRETDFGALAQGCKARFLHVAGREYEKAGRADQLLQRLISCGRPESISWIGDE